MLKRFVPSLLLLQGLAIAGQPPILIETPAVEKVTAAASAPDPLESMRAETAKLQAEREKLQAEMSLAETKLSQKLAPQKLVLMELQAQMEEMKTKMELVEMQRKSSDDPAMLELRR